MLANLRTLALGALLASATAANGANLLLTNDDGWAVAIIRAQYEALVSAGHSVVLSAPAENKSGTGSSSTTPTPRTSACEFNSCPAGSPAIGTNSSNTRFNYVNAYPVDSAKYGIQTLAPKFFGGAPALIVSGPNVGQNTGTTVNVSGTVGAAVEAAREGLPAVAFSGSSSSISQVSYTTLNTASSGTTAARTYASVTARFVASLLAGSSSAPLVPKGTILNVNYPASSGCSAASFKFVLSRVIANSAATDVTTCGSSHLPGEAAVVARSGCYASVSVVNATNKADVGASTQALVVQRLGTALSCLP